jgi:hypothetical protein
MKFFYYPLFCIDVNVQAARREVPAPVPVSSSVRGEGEGEKEQMED